MNGKVEAALGSEHRLIGLTESPSPADDERDSACDHKRAWRTHSLPLWTRCLRSGWDGDPSAQFGERRAAVEAVRGGEGS